jgi:SAM-dependent methyltransferase
MSDELEFTGERFVPGVAGEIWYEHWHRYHFAAPLVAGREVLDVACGAGYGSALLARSAAKVTGADLSAAAIAHACSRYADIPNLAFRQADCAALPFADASFDAVVSFETIEHITTQEGFLDEVRRVCGPAALHSVVPQQGEYSDRRRDQRNPRAELYRTGWLRPCALAPRLSFYSVVWPGGRLPEVSEVGRPRRHRRVTRAHASSCCQRPRARSGSCRGWSSPIDDGSTAITRKLCATQARTGAATSPTPSLRGAAPLSTRTPVRWLQAAERARLARIAPAAREARRAILRWWLALPAAAVAG